jgi:hypothetical protein
MGRGIANSGSILLTTVRNSYSFNIANVVQTNTITTVSTGNVAVPTGAVWANVQIWSGGGGGRGYFSGSVEYGGGGSGYCSLEIPVEAGTNIGYRVGDGGDGGAPGANGDWGGISWINNIWDGKQADGQYSVRYGTRGWTSAALSFGGWGDAAIGSWKANGVFEVGANGTSSGGGTAAGPGGGAGGSGTNGAAGAQPGGGGAPNNNSGGSGGKGGAGKVIMTFYGPSNANNLTDFFREGTYNRSPGAVGYNGIIPSYTAPVKLTDFKGADQIGWHANTFPNPHNMNPNVAFQSLVMVEDGPASGYARMNLESNGAFSQAISATNVNFSDVIGDRWWMDNMKSPVDATICQYFDAKFIKTAASGYDTATYGSAVNTWIQAGQAAVPGWGCYASQVTEGAAISHQSGYLLIRRRNDNVELSNIPVYLKSHAENWHDYCPTCCFTPETLITMYDMSTKAIGTIQVGEFILSRSGVKKQVTEIITRENRVMYRFLFADGRVLDASEDHPLYVAGKGYASMNPTIEYKGLGIPQKIAVNDFVIDQNGIKNKIVSITDLYYPHTVYTFAESEFYAGGMLVY